MKIILGLVALFVLVAVINYGFLGTDEYWVGIVRYIPAQTSTIAKLVTAEDVKSPLQLLPFHALAQGAWQGGGITNPYSQYRVVQIGLAIFNSLLFGLLLWVGLSRLKSFPSIYVFMFFYPMAFLFTRPMFESVSAPWVFGAVLFAVLYDQEESQEGHGTLRNLLIAVSMISVAFMARPQVGLCAPALLIAPLVRRRWRHLSWACTLGLLFFVTFGFADGWLRGTMVFHESLRHLISYNAQFGDHYGLQPWYTYLLLLPLLVLAPFWSWSRTALKESYRLYRVAWWALAFFVIGHSFFSQKFERFLIPIVPVVVLLSGAFLRDVYTNLRNKKIRVGLLLALNSTLFLVTSFSPPQRNIIDMALYFDQHPEIQRIYNYNEAITWIPDVFINGGPKFEWKDWTPGLIVSKQQCIVFNEYDVDHLTEETLKKSLSDDSWSIEHFKVNWVETIAYKLNPTSNRRRSALVIFCKII